MTVVVWVLAAAIVAGVAGWKLGRASGLWTVTLNATPDDPDHEGCRREIDRLTEERDVLNMATAFLLACLYGGGDDPDDELQRLLDSGGGGS